MKLKSQKQPLYSLKHLVWSFGYCYIYKTFHWLGGNNVLARQLFKRLETEGHRDIRFRHVVLTRSSLGYIVEQFVTLDELGFPETRSRSLKDGRKTKGKQTKTRRNVQKSKFKFNGQAVLTAAYMDYFQPDPKVESRILGLSELVDSKSSWLLLRMLIIICRPP